MASSLHWNVLYGSTDMPQTDTRSRNGSGSQPSRNDDTLNQLAAIQSVAQALTAAGTLHQLASRALSRMRESLDLDVVAMHLPHDDGDDAAGDGHVPALRQFAVSAAEKTSAHPRTHLALDAAAWRLLVAARGPVVFGEAGGGLVPNPFDPPAESWLVLPLQSQGEMVGAVVAARRTPIVLDAPGVMALSALGNLLGAGIATARLRTEIQRTAVQRERMRLAADLHDGLAQDLALAMRELALLESSPSPDIAAASWLRLREAVEAAHRVVRAGLEDLSVVVPVGGMCEAVEELCNRFRRAGLPVVTEVVDADVDVPAEVLSAVLRVVQEALTNVQRHADATRVVVRITVVDDELRLEIFDDGRGIGASLPTPGDGHFGIWIMRERARAAGGLVEVGSGSGGGTAVTMTVPLHGHAATVR